MYKTIPLFATLLLTQSVVLRAENPSLTTAPADSPPQSEVETLVAPRTSTPQPAAEDSARPTMATAD